MHLGNRPLRSVLFSPASSARRLDKLRSLDCDGVIVDLEDAVAVDQKDAARDNLVRFGQSGGAGNRLFLARINAVGTPWFEADLQAAVRAGPDGIVLPKAETASDIVILANSLAGAGDAADVAILAMVETPLAVLNLREIATASQRLAGLILGANDLIKDLGAVPAPDRAALGTAIRQTVMTARAYGLICLDSVFNAVADMPGLEAECAQGRLYGYDGKTLIHPNQIAAANAAFGPTEAEIDLARRKIEAFEQAQAAGRAITVFEGEMLEELHIRAARALLDKAAAIAVMEQDGSER